MITAKAILKRAQRIQKRRSLAAQAKAFDPRAYVGRPVEYAREVLGIEPSPDQELILRRLQEPPYRVLVPSGHDTGKTCVAAIAANFRYDTCNPGAVFTLGPRHDSLKDTLWSEIRLQRLRAKVRLPDDFIGPSAPEMRSAPNHWAKGLTAAKDASLTGRHLPSMTFIIEEACGVDPVFWHVVQTMFDPSLGHCQLAIFNPTDTTSQAYQEDARCDDADGEPRWHRIRLSALDHPNIAAELLGKPRPVRHAVSVKMVEEWLADWCELVENPQDVRSTDVEWPPSRITGHPGVWYRPGPIFQARALGLWPDAGAGVWSPSLWEAVKGKVLPFPPDGLPQLGVDCATGKGEDWFALHARWGPASVYHETANTMDPARICDRVKEVCHRMVEMANARRSPQARRIEAKEILIKIDDDGTGNAVGSFLRRDGYSVSLVGAGTSAMREDLYPRKRDELWFEVAERARRGQLALGRLDRKTLARLRQQLLAPTWELRGGQRVVEKKDDTKEKIGRSPDDADAMNLAYYDCGGCGIAVVTPEPSPAGRPRPWH